MARIGSPEFGVDDEQLDDVALNAVRTSGLSVREVSRQSGIPYSTLQGVLQIGGPQPSPTTLARLEAWAGGDPVTTVRRLKTWASDTRMWTDEKLADLQPPPGATHFRFAGLSRDSPTGYVSTEYKELRRLSPYDYIVELGADVRNVGRVIWSRQGG